MRFLWIATFCLILTTGCVEKMAGSINSIKADRPLVEMVNKDHQKAKLSIGAIEDRKQEQSRGLGLVSNKTFEVYANNILAKLKDASGVRNIPGRIYLKAENAWSAKSTASGNIYIPVGILGDINSEDVFAALLAHELSHVIQNDADADLMVKLSKKSVYVTSFVNNLSNKDDADSDAYLASLGAFAASELFLSPGWSRQQEYRADAMGLDVLIRAGYSPNAMEELLEIVEVLDERNKIELEKRQQMLRDANSKVRNDAIRTLDYNSMLKSTVADAVNFVGGELKNLMATHGSGNQRIDELREYKKQYYRRVPRKKYRIESWRAALNTEEMRQVVQSLEKSFLANDYLVKGDLTKSEKIIRSGIKSSTKKQSYVRTVFADVRKAQGQQNYALKNHAIALTGEYPPFSSYKAVLTNKIATDHTQTGKIGYFNELLSVFSDYGRPPEYFQEMIILADSLQLPDQVAMLETECSIKYAGDGVSCSKDRTAGENNLSFKGFFQSF